MYVTLKRYNPTTLFKLAAKGYKVIADKTMSQLDMHMQASVSKLDTLCRGRYRQVQVGVCIEVRTDKYDSREHAGARN